MTIQNINNITQHSVRHGGNLSHATNLYGGDKSDWLDLSTGISPWPYPIGEISIEMWHQLPDEPEQLIKAAANYYGCSESAITPTPGSQLAIRILPTLLSTKQSVAIPKLGYQEHAYSWQVAGHTVILYSGIDELQQLLSDKKIENAVVINPNNPSGEHIDCQLIKTIAKKLAGVMIIDEAFADCDKSISLSSDSQLGNIIILRSLGKFFGLAGARVGFVIGTHPINNKLAQTFSPWSISAPAQHIAELALQDTEWQLRQLSRIHQQANAMDQLLSKVIAELASALPHSKWTLANGFLFYTITSNEAVIQKLHDYLATQRIWTRIGDPLQSRNWLRCSLPGDRFDALSKVLRKPLLVSTFLSSNLNTQ